MEANWITGYLCQTVENEKSFSDSIFLGSKPKKIAKPILITINSKSVRLPLLHSDGYPSQTQSGQDSKTVKIK
jgi:hypothetical protein